MRTTLIFSIALAVWACRTTDTFRGTEMPERPIADFKLPDQNGRLFKLSDHRGKVVLFFFGYTFCPDVCPLTLSTWKRVHDALGADTAKVKFVYVTVDPQRDTPEKLKTHLAVFSSDILGLTGSPAALKEVYADFGVYIEKVNIAASAAGYLMNHTTRMFVVDQTGVLRLLIGHDAPVEDVAHDIRLLLKEKK
ncbi:MAG: SCO family protein [candidate division KSB1 bacterium]|nr:SCO family protein [candidate division KSB1 bacterium]MDZ7364819.1 SCO family protein [candidate division KSB1 bacterium]MDZ7402922.1 SCO family protein [candidate division KSB1 bacterium]